MKKIIPTMCLTLTMLISADAKAPQTQRDCVESLQNEIREILYSNSVKNEQTIQGLTDKINEKLETDCDVNVTESKSERKARLKKEEEKATQEYVLILDTTKSGSDCVEDLQNEVAKILYSNGNNQNKDKKVKLVIQGDAENCVKPASK